MIQTVCRQSIEVCPYSVVYIVEGGDDAPQAIDLGVVLVDLGDYEDEGREKQRDGERRDEGVRREVDILEPLQVGDVGGNPIREVVELGKKRLDRLRVVGTVAKRLHKWKRRIDENARVRHCGCCCRNDTDAMRRLRRL
jgi:hypothetical protein